VKTIEARWRTLRSAVRGCEVATHVVVDSKRDIHAPGARPGVRQTRWRPVKLSEGSSGCSSACEAADVVMALEIFGSGGAPVEKSKGLECHGLKVHGARQRFVKDFVTMLW
jgi:hypothetical protein